MSDDEKMVYEPPALIEVGAFATLTMGGWAIGEDNFWTTIP